MFLLLVTIIPPSPVVITLVVKKLIAPASPRFPAGIPLNFEPCACAASSIKGTS